MDEKPVDDLSGAPWKVRETFERLCEAYPAEYTATVRQHVDAALSRLRALGSGQLGDSLRLAEQLADCSYFLLQHYDQYSSEDQALIMGAIRYFVIEIDSTPDTIPFVGLDDDVLVMNHALVRLGLHDKIIA